MDKTYLDLDYTKQYLTFSGKCSIMAEGNGRPHEFAYTVYKAIILKDFPTLRDEDISIKFLTAQSDHTKCVFTFSPDRKVPDSYEPFDDHPESLSLMG